MIDRVLDRQPQRCVLVVDPNNQGGHISFCHRLSAVLAGGDLDVTYLNREVKARQDVNYHHHVTGLPGNGFFVKFREYLRMAIAVRKYSRLGYVVFWQSINLYLLLSIALVILFGGKCSRWVLTLHNIVPHSEKKKEHLEYWLVEQLAQSWLMDSVVFHFDFFRSEEYQSKYYNERLKRKMNFVAHHSFLTAAEVFKLQGLNQKKFDPKNEVSILIFGVVRRNKGVVEFFRLLNDLNFDLSHVKFTVAGRCVEGTAEALKGEIGRLTESGKVVVLDQYISDQEKAALFSKADYVLLPYLGNFLAQSGVALDAYDYGVPLIVSRNISLEYLVREENTGYVFDKDSAAEVFQRKIMDLVQHDIYSNNIRRLTKEKYSDVSIRKEYEKILYV